MPVSFLIFLFTAYMFLAACWVFHCGTGFSLCQLLPILEHRLLGHTGSVVVHRFNCPEACGVDLPGPGRTHVPCPHRHFQPLDHQGSPKGNFHLNFFDT